MKVLIVGTGPVSYSFYRSLIRKFGKKVEISLSDYKSDKDFKQSFFGPSTIFYRQGYRGLGKYWHGVLDVDLVKSFGRIEKDSYFHNFNKVESECYDYVPFNVPRFVSNLEIKPHVVDIIDVRDDKVIIKHKDFKETYDLVFFGIGFAYKNDPLISSGIATRSSHVSDHLIFNSTNKVKYNNKIIFSKKGHFRNYKIENFGSYQLKKSYRPVISKSVINPKNKAIYTTGKYQIIINIIKSGLFPQLISSLHLRYGFPALSRSGYNFYQTDVKNIYKYDKSNNLILNKDQVNSKEFKELLKYYNIDKNSILSGIHLFGGYKKLEKNDYISVNSLNIKNSKVIIVTPNINCDIDSRHFTSYFMRLSEIIGGKVKLC